jgi:FdhD protein
MTKNASLPINYIHSNSKEPKTLHGNVIVETPVSLTINGEMWITFMCTPVDLDALAVGFVYNERLIEHISEVESVFVCASNENVDIWLNHEVKQPQIWRRTSGCTGGQTSIDSSCTPDYIVPNGYVLFSEDIEKLVDSLYKDQLLYKVTGGVHTSCLCDGENVVISCEDIGRHNTLDKIAGRYLLEKIELSKKIILSTGRISSEMLQKSARIGAAFVISRTSPSSLSIELAEKFGITLIGYAHRNQFNVYTHPERVIYKKKNMDKTNQGQIGINFYSDSNERKL